MTDKNPVLSEQKIRDRCSKRTISEELIQRFVSMADADPSVSVLRITEAFLGDLFKVADCYDPSDEALEVLLEALEAGRFTINVFFVAAEKRKHTGRRLLGQPGSIHLLQEVIQQADRNKTDSEAHFLAKLEQGLEAQPEANAQS